MQLPLDSIRKDHWFQKSFFANSQGESKNRGPGELIGRLQEYDVAVTPYSVLTMASFTAHHLPER